MAISFTRQPSLNNYVPYGNNIVFEFTETNTNVSYAEVSIMGNILRFYPSPLRSFYVNLRQIIRALVVNKNLLDVANYNDIFFKTDIIITTRTVADAQISVANFTNCVFVPQAYEYGEVNSAYAKTGFLPMNAQKIVKFGELPLSVYYGLNTVGYKVEAVGNIYYQVEKRSNECGTYLKFLNKKGGYSFWLFSEAQITKSIQSYGELFNDFLDAQETTSPRLQIGKETKDIYTCTSGMLKPYENEIVADIFTSSKVFLYLNNANKWLEIKVTNSSVKTKDAKRENIEYTLTFEKPLNGTLTL